MKIFYKKKFNCYLLKKKLNFLNYIKKCKLTFCNLLIGT